jgi:hypothetical protein
MFSKFFDIREKYDLMGSMRKLLNEDRDQSSSLSFQQKKDVNLVSGKTIA